ncbi:hypothetical protein LTS08_000268 [Lithohypha guttulata]|nr:hypothetical protein LTS08_000268 [Lithohypha guttulata]
MTEANEDELDASQSQALLEYEQHRYEALERPAEGPTLLWRTIANGISASTGAATVTIRAGVVAGKWGLIAGKKATHGLIGLNQTICEAVLRAAGREVNSRADLVMRQEEAESLVEKWLTRMHTRMSAASIIAASTFYLAETAMYWTSDTALIGLHFLNALFGSTETSRAVAAIVTLLKRELYKPQPDGSYYDISTFNLLTTVASFLFLQRNARRQTELEWRATGGEATVWDIVINDQGFRADVIGTRRSDAIVATSTSIVQSPTQEESGDDFTVIAGQIGEETFINPGALDTHDEMPLTDEQIRQRIMEQLPQGTRATITTDTMLVKTVQVEIHGSETANVEAPPGMVMVSERPNFEQSPQGQIITFRTVSKAQSKADVNKYDGSKSLVNIASDATNEDDSTPTASNTNSSDSPDVAEGQGSSSGETTSVEMRSRQIPNRATAASTLSTPVAVRKKTRGATPEINHSQTPRPSKLPQSSSRRGKSVDGSRADRNDRSGVWKKALKSLSPPQSSATLNRMISGPSRARSNSGSGTAFSLSQTLRPLTSNKEVPRKPVFDLPSSQATTPMTEFSLRHANGDSGRHHRRTNSFAHGLVSVGAKDKKDETLVLAPRVPIPRRSIFENDKMLMALAKDGKVPGQFPSSHLILTLRRFVRFASAAYGEQFLSFMGMYTRSHTPSHKKDLIVHPEHSAFSEYTGLPPETIIKSSFIDVQGLEYTWSDGWSPLIHFVAIDLEAKAIVLTCRGTLGFEDLLTDMACDYTDIYWQGQPYKVHRGIRESARRLMDSSNGNHIMATLKQYLEEYPEFGLVFVGHSLGGAVAAVLAIMLSEPTKHVLGELDSPAFVTATKPRLLPSRPHTSSSRDIPPIQLPAGRPIHVYAFGSPAAVSSSLRIATRGLITSVVNANDIVPCLSLGTLHDFRAIAALLGKDLTGAYQLIRERISERVRKTAQSWCSADYAQPPLGPPPPYNVAGDRIGEDTWMWKQLCGMRKVMTTEKLYAPGEIFILESTRVFDRDPDETTITGAEQSRQYTPVGRPATRIQFKWVRDVEGRFNEVRFGRTMFHEHAPSAYENNLSALESGVIDDA